MQAIEHVKKKLLQGKKRTSVLMRELAKNHIIISSLVTKRPHDSIDTAAEKGRIRRKLADKADQFKIERISQKVEDGGYGLAGHGVVVYGVGGYGVVDYGLCGYGLVVYKLVGYGLVGYGEVAKLFFSLSLVMSDVNFCST